MGFGNSTTNDNTAEDTAYEENVNNFGTTFAVNSTVFQNVSEANHQMSKNVAGNINNLQNQVYHLTTMSLIPKLGSSNRLTTIDHGSLLENLFVGRRPPSRPPGIPISLGCPQTSPSRSCRGGARVPKEPLLGANKDTPSRLCRSKRLQNSLVFGGPKSCQEVVSEANHHSSKRTKILIRVFTNTHFEALISKPAWAFVFNKINS